MKQRIQRDRSAVDVRQLAFDDGQTATQNGATLEIRTTILISQTMDGNTEEMEGMKQRIVTLRHPLVFDRLGQSATMTLSTGDTWRVFPKDTRTLVETQ